jgi:hypothetical protein
MATLTNPQFTKKQIERVCVAALESLVEDLAVKFRELIESPVFAWPGATVRQSGEVVGSPRNIVDLGNLRDSQETQRLSAAAFRYSWDVLYAAYVFYGYTLLNGESRPGRDWITPVIKDALKLFAEEVRKRV